MSEPEYVVRDDGARNVRVYELVRFSDHLPGMFAFLMGELEEEHRRLRVYFQALLIVLQLPGGDEYEYEGLLDGLEERIAACDRNTLFNVLRRCINQLVARERSIRIHELGGRAGKISRKIIEQVPGGEDYRVEAPPAALRGRIDQLDGNGLLNVVAECLDRLMIHPLLGEDKSESKADEEDAEQEE